MTDVIRQTKTTVKLSLRDILTGVVGTMGLRKIPDGVSVAFHEEEGKELTFRDTSRLVVEWETIEVSPDQGTQNGPSDEPDTEGEPER